MPLEKKKNFFNKLILSHYYLGQNPPSATTLAARENLQNTLHQTLQQQREFRKPSTPATPSTPPVDFTPSTSYNPTSAAAAPPPYHAPPASQVPASQPTGLKMPTLGLLGNTTLVGTLASQAPKTTPPAAGPSQTPPAVPSQPAVVAAAASAPKKGLSLTVRMIF